MAQLRNIFVTGVETIFGIFNEAVHSGVFTQTVDDGFSDPVSTTDVIRCIFETFKAKDVELLSFSELIQPQDVKGLMPASDLVNCKMNTQTHIIFGDDVYSVEGHELDPMSIVYTLLLRKV